MSDKEGKLWEIARAIVDDDLDFSSHDNINIVAGLKEATSEAQRVCISKRWQFITLGKRKEKVIIRDLLGKIAVWAELFATIGDQVVQYDPGHMSLPWAGVRFLLQIAINDIKKFDFVIEGAEQIARMVTRYRIFEKLYLNHLSLATEDLKDSLIKLYASMINYLAKAKRYFEQNTGARILKSGLLARGDFEELLISINVAESEVDRYAVLVAAEMQNDMNNQMTTLTLNMKENNNTLRGMLKSMDCPVHRISSQLDSVEDHLHKIDRMKILDWLSTQPYADHHMSITSRVLKGTGQWLLSHPTFKRWKIDSSNSLLWLHGIHGTGKSCLISTLLEDSMSSSVQYSIPPPVYFYCSRNTAEPERSDATQILACIARQLSSLTVGSPILGPTLAARESIGSQGFLRRLNLEEICRLIVELTENYSITTIVIDALDECDLETRCDLIEALEKTLQDSTSLIKVLISSREENDIKYRLQQYPSIQVTENENGHDIETFVNIETDKLVARNRLLTHVRPQVTKDNLRLLIKTDVIRGAGEMFRWAQLQLQSLQWIRFEKDIRAALGKIPRQLSDIYHDVYEKMISTEHEMDRIVITNVLRWMLCTTRRLAFQDFFAAISINIDITVEEIYEDVILDLLHNFVVSDNNEGNQTFRFAHLSVREFLEQRPEYSTSATNALAAEICLLSIIGISKSPVAEQFLCDHGLDPLKLRLSTTESYKDSIRDYSLRFWPIHSQRAGEYNRTADGLLKESLHYFLFNDSDEDNPLNFWVRSRQRKKLESVGSANFRRVLTNHRSSSIRAFFLGCAFGFKEVVTNTIKSSDIDHDLREEGLLVAIHHRQHDPLRLLLASESNFEISEALLVALVQYNSDYEALEWLLYWQNPIRITRRVILAAKSSSAKVMEFLLDHSQGLAITDDILESASWAADAGAMRVLLSRASNTKVTTKLLSSSVRFGNSEVFSLLLDIGIRPEIITPYVIEQAAYSGKTEALKLLLGKVESLRITEETMMGASLCRNGPETVQMLVDHGGKITQDMAVEAARQGTAKVLALLLQQGCQITDQLLETGARNVIDGTEVMKLLLHKYQKTLTEAEWAEILRKAANNTWHGVRVVELLLDVRVDCKIPEEVLWAVTKNGISGTQILDTMLKDGRDMEITSDVVEAALRNLDYDDVLSTLLDKYNSSVITGEMLAAAATNRRFGDEIVRLLLSRSAVVCVPTDEVLKAVVVNSHSGFEILRLLEDKFGQFTFSTTLIEAAIANGGPAIAELVLDRQPKTPITEALLSLTASSGSTEVMKLLLKRSSILVTEEMVANAAGNRECSREMTKLLLAQSHHIKVHSAMIKRATCLEFDAEDTLRVLLRRAGRIKLGSDVFVDAVKSQYCSQVIVSLLLNANIEAEVTEDVFFEVAKSKDAVDLIKLFADNNFEIQVSKNMVESAIERGNAHLLDLFLQMESDFKVQINHRMLDIAARNGQEEILKLLSEHKLANSEERNWQHIASLHCAALKGKADKLKELIGLGVDPDVPDSTGRTPLSWAVAPGTTHPDYWKVGSSQNEVVRLLVNAKVNTESRDHDGRTPLCWAAFGGQRAAVRILLDAGAVTQVHDAKGETPASIARSQGYLRLAKVLQT